MKKSHDKQSALVTARGFTLIEILIVVAIIAVLAGSVLVGFGPAQKQGRDLRRVNDLRQTQHSLELYFAKCGYYPGVTQAGVPPCGAFSAISSWAALTSALTGSNIGTSQIPNDPSSGKTYLYGTDANGTSYVIGATLEDLNNPVLQSSPVGTTFGINCNTGGNGVYCIQF